jgi:hypothetical protein
MFFIMQLDPGKLANINQAAACGSCLRRLNDHTVAYFVNIANHSW